MSYCSCDRKLLKCLVAATETMAEPGRGKLSSEELQEMVEHAVTRLQLILPELLAGLPGFLRWLAVRAVSWPFSIGLRAQMRDALQKRLGGNFTSGTTQPR